MSGERTKLWLALSWLWIALVSGVMIWGAIDDSGLYRWLADRVDLGARSDKWLMLLPILVLGAPAFIFIRRHTAAARATEGTGPEAEARRGRRVAGWTAAIGLFLLLAGGGAWLLSRGVPDGSEAAVPLDAARLGAEPAPDYKVRIAGRADPGASSIVSRREGDGERAIYYVAFLLDDAAKNAPVRIFIERSTAASDRFDTVQAFLPDQTGYLIENGVPDAALRDLARRGIAVATPHYLLRTRELARRENYYVVAALGIGIGAICLMVAGIGGLQARSRRKLADALARSKAQGY